MAYKQLTQDERYQIYALRWFGAGPAQIARELKRSVSTICRELERNSGQRGYRPQQAHKKAQARQHERASQRRIPENTWELVREHLHLDHSPEQISAVLRQQHELAISHESIYQYILWDKRAGGELYQHLRCQKVRRKRYGSYDRRGLIPNRRSITERPAAVERRARLGDFEIDTVYGRGHRHALVTVVDRCSRLTLVAKVDRPTAGQVAQAIVALLWPYRDQVLTLTSDNGKEFAYHEWIAEQLDADYYFARPHAAWERGTNENTNGLLRQYFPRARVISVKSPSGK